MKRNNIVLGKKKQVVYDYIQHILLLIKFSEIRTAKIEQKQRSHRML